MSHFGFMKVCILGGGIFGCTAATFAARAGHDVTLFETKDSLLRSATSLNQLRLHEGYHYPRSPKTVDECQRGLESFENEYDGAIVYDGDHHYAIAREGSKVTPGEYLNFCEEKGLKYEVVSANPLLNDQNVDLVIKAREVRIDPSALRGLCWQRLAMDGVEVVLGKPWDNRRKFDKTVVACYAGTGAAMSELGIEDGPYQYEVCEKPVIRLPDEHRLASVVVMDGEFCSLDPYGNTGLHVMGHVKHAIHHTNVGMEPEIPEHIKPLIDSGIRGLELTRFYKFIAAAREFIPILDKAKHIGSMFTVRAVLPNKDKTDERPTIVTEINDRVIRIFSGKLVSAVTAAQEVVAILDRTHGPD